MYAIVSGARRQAVGKRGGSGCRRASCEIGVFMDGFRFDQFTRGVAKTGSRRAFTRWAVGLASVAAAAQRRGASAEPCPAGNYFDGNNCLPCPPGSYTDLPDQPACTLCAPGSAQPDSPETLPTLRARDGAAAGGADRLRCLCWRHGPAGKSGQATCPACADAATPPGSTVCSEGSICPAKRKFCAGRNYKSRCCKRHKKCGHRRSGKARCRRGPKHCGGKNRNSPRCRRGR